MGQGRGQGGLAGSGGCLTAAQPDQESVVVRIRVRRAQVSLRLPDSASGQARTEKVWSRVVTRATPDGARVAQGRGARGAGFESTFDRVAGRSSATPCAARPEPLS